MDSLISLLLVVLALALATVAVLLLAAWRHQERILFQPPAGPFPELPGGAAARVSYAAVDGQPLFAYVVDPRTDTRSAPLRVVLAFHGNAEIAAWSIPWAREAARRTGAVVVLPEYRGYAGLPGQPTYAASTLDAGAALALAERMFGATPERTVLYGHSLGSAVAVELAQHAPPRALLLESPFSSARAMAGRMGVPVAGPLWGMISRIHFDSRARVATLDAPVWVVHGTRDVVIPARMGSEVHAAARRQGELLLVEGAGHNDVVERGGEAYWGWVARAVAR